MKIRELQYAQAAGAAALTKYMPTQEAKKALRRSFAKKLVELRGVPMKLSQILSMGKNDDQALAHREAMAEVEPIPFKIIEGYLKEYAPDLVAKIDYLDDRGIPASLGQVHQARLKDKRLLAVKIKYPGIHPHMNMDNALFGLIAKTFDNFKEGFSLKDYQKVIRAELEGELDYQGEIRKQDLLFKVFAGSKSIVIPQAFPDLSGESHLVMSWEEGLSIEQFMAVADKKQKQDAVNCFLDFYLTTIFIHHILHADPNRGNFAFRISGDQVRLVVYDFGSVVSFDNRRTLSLLKLMHLTKSGGGNLLPWLVNFGFDARMLSPLRENLPAFCEVLFEPLLSERRYSLSDWNRKKRAEDILGEHRWNFMIAANADLLPFMRAIQGMFYYIDLLDVGMYAWPKISEILTHYKTDLLGLELPELEAESVSPGMAKCLRIEVMENGQQKVALSFPRISIENLEEIMPDDVKKKLSEQNISMDAIVKRSRQSGYRPMDLFKVNNDGKNIRVFLE